ncbi:MAG: YdcF family protein [Betaproteobacteria bacterium]
MNALVGDLGLGWWKAVLAALVLPPVPLLLLALAGGALLWRRRGVGWLVLGIGVVGGWLCGCAGFGELLDRALLHPPPALSAQQRAALRLQARTDHDVAIVVLGGGRELLAPEYGASSLPALALERLRYGVWLGRETGAPLAFSGGPGFGHEGEIAEAEIAARIAAADFGRPLRWLETASRDTRENAARSIALLRPAGVATIVLVTHGWHMPRAARAFREASQGRVRIVAAPMGLAPRVERPLLRWMPTAQGLAHVHHVLHEALGLLAGS